MVRKIADDRLDHPREVGVLHADSIGVRSGLKHDRIILRQESIHVDRDLVEVAERRLPSDRIFVYPMLWDLLINRKQRLWKKTKRKP